ncbi:hypothetical protein [Pseudarthrobacter sp. fls2-241-R2A-168]|uniref:hypothetical protein n=1 Tax=Pseudarthrobacter sp. fls2-241-R2A-168 TaxID=3040304 RepID=UPI002554E533|nr:hypothetical protein [Pseudarthrobacter sp. fls2-241-R2A-168]
MIIPITVHVPERLVEDFYIRFGEFIADVPDPDAPTILPSGAVPSWVQADDAQAIADSLWDAISLPGKSVLRFMARATGDDTRHFPPREIADGIGHPKGTAGVAGLFGGVGKAIRRAGLPVYTTAKGTPWHYIWGWDGERYSMTPEVARLLRKAAQPGARSAAQEG